MKATKGIFHFALQVRPAHKSVDKTLVCDHSQESYWTISLLLFTLQYFVNTTVTYMYTNTVPALPHSA